MTGALLLLSMHCALAQWTYKTVQNGFDDPFRKAYTQTNNGGFLAMEEDVEQPLLYLYGTYFCDDLIEVDMVFQTPSGDKKYRLESYKSKDSKILFFDQSLANEEFVSDFKSATRVRIRVNESHCRNEYYEFSMSGSTKALQFIRGQ